MSAAFTVGEVVAVRPSKIVAGQEVEKTNEFLQILASAVLKKVGSWGHVLWGGHRIQVFGCSVH